MKARARPCPDAIELWSDIDVRPIAAASRRLAERSTDIGRERLAKEHPRAACVSRTWIEPAFTIAGPVRTISSRPKRLQDVSVALAMARARDELFGAPLPGDCRKGEDIAVELDEVPLDAEAQAAELVASRRGPSQDRAGWGDQLEEAVVAAGALGSRGCSGVLPPSPPPQPRPWLTWVRMLHTEPCLRYAQFTTLR